MCFVRQEGSYITDFTMPNIFCQNLHCFFFSSFSASLLLFQRKISHPPFLPRGNTVSKYFTQLKGKLKFEPPFIRYGIFSLLLLKTNCLPFNLPNDFHYLFSKNMLPLDKPTKYVLRYPHVKSFFHKLFQPASRNSLGFCNNL